MTAYVVDAPAVIELVAGGFTHPGSDRLLAPALIRSQVLSRLQTAVAEGSLDRRTARDYFDRVNGLKIRLLGDSQLRRTAWKVADDLGWTGTFDAEFVALTQMHADALITGDAHLARAAQGAVEIVPVSALL